MSSATSAQLTMSAGSPGSRSNTTMVGVSMSERAMGAWISSPAMLAAHTSAGAESRQQYWIGPERSPGPGTVRIQPGRWPGQRFSKNEPASTPSGKRRRVTPRSSRCGDHDGATRA